MFAWIVPAGTVSRPLPDPADMANTPNPPLLVATVVGFGAALGVAALAGCSGGDAAPAVAVAKPAPEAPTQTPAPAAPAGDRATRDNAASAAKPPATEQAAWTPPFPNRNDPFQPPRYGRRRPRTDTADAADRVVLMGFANVGEPKALLAIDGVVTPLPEGGEAEGVKVFSIAPPKAVLQRGRTRWTASIE